MTELEHTEALYRRYGESVHRRCRRLLRDDALAREALQEVFLRAHQHAREVRAAGSALAWLLTVADRHCLGQLRRRRVAERADALLHLQAAALEGRGDDAALERTLVAADLVVRVLALCPEDVQRVATHRYLDELEQEQIAQLLDVSRKTVQRKLQAFHDVARGLLAEASHAAPERMGKPA